MIFYQPESSITSIYFGDFPWQTVSHNQILRWLKHFSQANHGMLTTAGSHGAIESSLIDRT
jgi:hypothetical protein